MTDSRSSLRRATFHVGGALVCGLALVVAGVAFLAASFGTSTCGDGPSRVGELRHWSLVIVVLSSAVPAAWSWFAWRCRLAWQPWATIALITAAVGLAEVASIHDTSTFCF